MSEDSELIKQLLDGPEEQARTIQNCNMFIVEPIIRTEFFVNIEGLEVDPGLEAQAKADMEKGLQG